ncbi:MAG: LysR family transcriptional regulator [Pseudomonadota bacterium]
MDKAFYTLDWALVQAFVAVAETGSLSAAARRLGLTQPTIGRQVAAMEAALSLDLFHRQPRGMAPTQTALALLPAAKAMEVAAHDLSLAAAGQAATPGGTVRITASVFAAHHILPPILAGLRAQAPEIALELVPSDTTENLLFREADIAVRMYRPTQLDVVTRHIGSLELGLFAATSYLDRVGRHVAFEALDFVGYDRSDLLIEGFAQAGVARTRDDFPVRCDLQTTYWELVRAGCGAGFCQKGVARADPGVEEISLGVEIPPLEVWLTSPVAIRHGPAVARVWDTLATALEQVVDRRP